MKSILYHPIYKSFSFILFSVVKELMKITFEMSAVDFFLQLGPDFKDYAEVFVKNGFNDVETIYALCISKRILILCSPRKLCHLAIGERLRKLLKHEECHWHWKPWAPFTNRWRKSSKCGNEVQFVKNERKQTRRNFQTRRKAGIGFIQTKVYGQICTYARTRWAI